MSEYIAKASIEPRDYRVVFLIQERTAGENSLPTLSVCLRFIFVFFYLDIVSPASTALIFSRMDATDVSSGTITESGPPE